MLLYLNSRGKPKPCQSKIHYRVWGTYKTAELGIPNEIRYFGISVLPAVLSGTKILNTTSILIPDTKWTIPFGIRIPYCPKRSSLIASNFEQLVLPKGNSCMFKVALKEDLNKGPDTDLQE